MSESLCVMSSLKLIPVPVSENISLWEDVLVSEATIFSVIVLFISLWGVCVCRNEQCFWWWCCHSFELGIGPMALLGESLQIGGFH